jgi:uncharacterized protein YggE
MFHIAKPAKLGGRARFDGSRHASGLLMLAAGAAIALVGTPTGMQAAEPMNPAPLPAPSAQDARTIEVTGNGEAHVAPDVASLNLAIQHHWR